jgi:hypothetical protein
MGLMCGVKQGVTEESLLLATVAANSPVMCDGDVRVYVHFELDVIIHVPIFLLHFFPQP